MKNRIYFKYECIKPNDINSDFKNSILDITSYLDDINIIINNIYNICMNKITNYLFEITNIKDKYDKNVKKIFLTDKNIKRKNNINTFIYILNNNVNNITTYQNELVIIIQEFKKIIEMIKNKLKNWLSITELIKSEYKQNNKLKKKYYNYINKLHIKYKIKLNEYLIKILNMCNNINNIKKEYNRINKLYNKLVPTIEDINILNPIIRFNCFFCRKSTYIFNKYNDITFFCDICYNKIDNTENVIFKCGHKCCTACLKSYLINYYKIKNE